MATGLVVNPEDRELKIKGAGTAKGHEVRVKEIPLNKIKLGRNSRLKISPGDMAGLMQSIREEGLLQPIGLVPSTGGSYEIAYGNRRFQAFQKLGLPSIPAMIHEDQKASDIDMKNLTENIQRRNLSLVEAGRYVTLLREQGLTSEEIAVRLGVSKSYVSSCMQAYSEVPEEYQDDLEVITTNQKLSPGKIAITTAKAIINAQKNYGLNKTQVKTLFKAAKHDDKFKYDNVNSYAASMKAGKKDVIKNTVGIRHVRVNVLISEDDAVKLEERFVNDGPCASLAVLFRDMIAGKRHVKVKVIS